MSIAVRGGGVAAATCAHLLDAADFHVSWQPSAGVQVPAIMLSAAALALLRDVYGNRDLFAGQPHVRRRVVKWGPGDSVSLPHDARVVSQDDLERELGQGRQWDVPAPGASVLTILTSPPLPAARRLTFGERKAEAVRVTLRGCAADECRIEAVGAGWLFLIPHGEGQGWLLGFGAPLDHLLQESELIAPTIAEATAEQIPFAAAPRLTMPLAGEDWLACGTAALRFDPICGDGTAQAVREAVLASAVVGALARGLDRAALQRHYRSMLVAAMRRHLDLSARFYASGGDGPWWRAQAAALASGHRACTEILAKMPEPQFALRDFALVPRALAA